MIPPQYVLKDKKSSNLLKEPPWWSNLRDLRSSLFPFELFTLTLPFSFLRLRQTDYWRFGLLRSRLGWSPAAMLPPPRAMHMTVRACVASRISERVHISLRVMYIPPLRMGYSIHFNNWTDNMLTVTWKFMYVRRIWTNYSWFENTSHYNLVPRVLYYLPGNEVEVTR